MTKADIVNAVAEKTGMPRKEAADAVELFLTTVREALENGEKVSLVGFGTFYVREKNARWGRNPRSGERIAIPRKRITAFKPGRAFRQMLNPGAPAPPASTDAS
jgi:DNA-binding protein HU-beta